MISFYEIDNTYDGFDFIDPNNKEQSIVTLMRKGKKPKDFVIAVINFTPVVHYEYKIGVPYYGVYEEIFNSDDNKYWGSGQTMANDELVAECGKWHNKDYHIKIKVPPMGVTFIKGKNITLSTVEIDENNKVLIGGKGKKIKMDKVKTKEL